MSEVHLTAHTFNYQDLGFDTAQIYGPKTRTQTKSQTAQNNDASPKQERDASPEAMQLAKQTLSYDEPKPKDSQAVSYYQSIATYEKREEIKQWVGVDIYI